MNILMYILDAVVNLFFLLVFASLILSYFMDPFHPLRRNIDRLVEPMLMPIRRVVPPLGRIDFSPVILIILVQIIASLLRNLLLSLII